MAVEDSTLTNSNVAADVKKIVLLKRNPNTTISNSNSQTSIGNNTLVSSIDLTQTPCRSNSSSPNLDIELTPEQSANLSEIDLNTGLDGFLLAALKNPKDRLFLLKLDREMERFINDKRPILRFSDLLEQEEEKPEKSVKIMRRQQINTQKLRSAGDSDSNSEGERKILTIEEREAAYIKARARIFNGESEQDENEGAINSSVINPNILNINNNEQQNNESASSSKTKNTLQNKVANVNNNNKNGKPSQQLNKPVGNNKNSNKNSANNTKTRQQQSARSQTFNYNPPMDRSMFLSKQGRPIGNFSGPPPMMHPYGPPFFNGHINMYDVNMVPIQPPILPPDMQVCHPMGNPYMNMPHEWNPTLPGPYNRPGVRSVWGTESFNAPPEMGGNPSLFNHQQNNATSFLPPRPSAQNEVRPQVHNNLKHLNQYPPPHYPQSHGSSYSENNPVANAPVSPMDNKSNKSPSNSPGSPMSQSGFDSSNSIWANKGQWNNVSSGEDGKSNSERQLDQKRSNSRSSTHVSSSQQREVPLFNPVWNNSSDSHAMNVFNSSSQSSTDYSTQNAPGVTLVHPQMYHGIVPPMSGPRRNNSGNHMIPPPMHQEYVNNVQRFPPMTGFPTQSAPPNVTGAIRPPKSSELFDPNNPPVSPSQNTNSSTTASSQISASQPSSTSTLSPLSSRPMSHTSSKSTSVPINKTSTSPWTGTSTGSKVASLPQNSNNANSRRKNATESTNNSNSNAVLDGTMMRSLSISSNSSQQGRTHHRPPSTSPSGNGKKKESGLLFDYSMQVPYEGVKPSEASEPPQPNHIIELYDFSESDDLMDITFSNATIKQISPQSNSPGKRPTILAIFKNAREANQARQNYKGVRFKTKMWEPLVKNGGNINPLIPAGEQSSNSSLSNKTNIEDSYEKHHQDLMNATHGLPLNGKQ
ncbi:3108_t:CDS:2 [Acaulospora colombiana]|uniref:3108_t:CDS:1 n=1 Tax=Acaulospora colombiana TaxID=27376 RepID=A0ACA9M9C1_9GLOM|nr:3108_t:CDS:2 [Acaulospora colombiana]